MQHAPGFLKIVEDAKTRVKECTVADVTARLKRGEKLNLIDVRDVAAGHLLAAERGRPGERYILGHRNMTLLEILQTLSRLTGLPAPRLRLPHWLPLAAAYAEGGLWRLTGRTPRVTPEAARMSRHRMFFDAGKAVRELGLPQSPVEDALGRAVQWFTDHGYAPGRRERTR